MRRHLGNIISVLWTMPRLLIKKLVHGRQFSTGAVERFSPNVVLDFWRGSTVVLGKRVRAHSGCKIRVLDGGRLELGSNVRLNYNCIFMCMDSIRVGEGSVFGPSVLVYDHDHDFRVGLEADEYRSAPVEIGKSCWIGAGTVILRGTKLGDNCVVGAGCVINGEYPANSVIVQKRETEVRSFEVRE